MMSILKWVGITIITVVAAMLGMDLYKRFCQAYVLGDKSITEDAKAVAEKATEAVKEKLHREEVTES